MLFNQLKIHSEDPQGRTELEMQRVSSGQKVADTLRPLTGGVKAIRKKKLPCNS